MVAIQQKIQSVNRETEEVQNVIIKGSDEHLDIVSHLTSITNNFTKELVELNEELVVSFNNSTKEEISTCLNSLNKLFSAVNKLKSIIRKSPLFPDVPQTYYSLTSAIDEMREIIYDLQNFRLGKNDDLDTYLAELNEL
jgi:hypothetical protein